MTPELMTGPQDSRPKLAENVTGVLRPYPEYKDSGVQWLGEIPSHWDVDVLGRLGSIVGGGTPSRDVPHFWDGDIPWITPRDMLLPEYLVALMTSLHGRSYFQLTAKQTTNLTSTNSSTLKGFPIYQPDIEEQERLLDHVARESSGLDVAIARSLREIDLLREYRARLIADAVTGKLDVRGVELPALDEADSVDDAVLGDEEAGEADLDAATEDAARAPEE